MKRANGEGSITYDSTKKRYQARITDSAGKRISKRFSTKAEADLWLSQIKADISRDAYVPSNDITLIEWIAEFLDTYKAGKVRATTFNTYIHTAKHIRTIGDIKLQDLTPYTVQKFYKELPEGMSGSVRIKIHQLLKASITKAVAVGLLKKNIMEIVEPPKKYHYKIEIFTDEELSKLNDFFGASPYYCYVMRIYHIALYTGMRLGEILGLKDSAIHEDYIEVNNNLQQTAEGIYDEEPKTTSSYRKIPHNSITREVLRRHIKSNSDQYVFRTASGNPLAPTNFERAWRKVCKGAGIGHKRFHALRHTYATRMLTKVPVANVSAILGHSNPDITYRYYVHSLPEIEEKMSAISETLFPNPKE